MAKMNNIFFRVKVAIHYYGRLAAKQGWRFDSTYDHKDEAGDPTPFVFVLGSGKVKIKSIGLDTTTNGLSKCFFFLML